MLEKAKGIRFDTRQVRATLDGIMTEVRLPIKLPKHVQKQDNGLYTLFADGDSYEDQHFEKIVDYIKPPYQPGQILYVRETWAEHDGAVGGILFKARCPVKLSASTKWRPSIHMPREAARIFPVVSEVRAERVWDITEEGARAEGFQIGDQPEGGNSSRALTARQSFMWTWQRLYDRGKYPWAINPWCWVIRFERVERGNLA